MASSDSGDQASTRCMSLLPYTDFFHGHLFRENVVYHAFCTYIYMYSCCVSTNPC